MKRIRTITSYLFLLMVATVVMRAADQAASAADHTSSVNNAAAAAVVSGQVQQGQPAPDFIEHLIDAVLSAFNVPSSGNTTTHYVLSASFLIFAVLLRRVVTSIVFRFLRKFAARTKTTLDDKLFPAMEAPAASFIMVTGIFAALKVLKLTPEADQVIGQGATVAFSLVIFWGLLRALGAVLDHLHEIAAKRQMGIAAFMPWVKKTLVAVFVVIGVLLVVQSLGYNVKAILGAAGIGGLAFALAAQDTIANLFGSLVVATDQPFRLGEFVRIGTFLGSVEDMGLRSTKLRALDKSLVVIPNKTVASESITNLSRFSQRRAEQVIGLTYDTTPEQMEAVVDEFRQMLLKEDYVDPTSVLVYFRDFSASSLDIWIVYVTKDGDFMKHMALRQRLNTEMMKIVRSHGLSFAFPTQTVVLDGPVANQLVAKKTADASGSVAQTSP